MKKVLLIISAFVLVASLTSCSSTKVEDEEKSVVTGGVGGVQIANPYYNFDTLEEAAEMAGFTMTLPEKEDLPDWIIRTDYRATNYNLMEIIYPGDENYEREIRFRKAITDKEDMSGDYRDYEKEEKIDINGRSVTVRMNGQKIYGAIWRDGKFAYSAHISDGMDKEELIKIIEVIK